MKREEALPQNHISGYLEGNVFANKYKLMSEIGRGSMSVVYKAVNINLHKEVAIKFPLTRSILSPNFSNYILQGAQLAASLSHPHITNTYDVDHHQGLPYVVMELIDGETVGDAVVSRCFLPLKQSFTILEKMVDALSYIHSKGIVHQNITPQNILLKGDDFPILSSFDLASSKESEPIPFEFLCMKDLEFLSPELLGGKKTDFRTDIWSLGVTFYYMLTGVSPFWRRNNICTIEAIARFNPPPPSYLNPFLPEEIDGLVMKMIEKDPEERFLDMKVLQWNLRERRSELFHEESRETKKINLWEGNFEGRTLSTQKGETYQILEVKGEGGFGIVYKAFDISLKRIVAIKRLKSEFREDKEALDRFYREAQAVSSINHPNVIQIYSIGEFDGTPFFVMPFLEGKDLEELIESRTTLPIGQVLDISISIASGLEALHKRDVIHRDLKPNNILLTENHEPIITDFGIAHLSQRSRITPAGVILGTFVYMSPEQIQNKPLSPASDLYSLGVILYEMITGRVPFDTDSYYVIVQKITQQNPREFIQLEYDFPRDISRIIIKLLNKDPEKRYQTAGELIRALKKSLEKLNSKA